MLVGQYEILSYGEHNKCNVFLNASRLQTTDCRILSNIAVLLTPSGEVFGACVEKKNDPWL